MSHAAFIPLDLFGVSAGGVCLVASLFHEVLSEHGPRSAYIQNITYGITLYYVAVAFIVSSFFGFLYFSRSYIHLQHQKRQHGLDFSAYSSWTSINFKEQLKKSFKKFKKFAKISRHSTPKRILYADVNQVEVPTLNIFPKWIKIGFIVSITALLWIARSPALQIFLVLVHLITGYKSLNYLINAGIISCILHRQIFDIAMTQEHQSLYLAYSPYFVHQIYVLTTIGIYIVDTRGFKIVKVFSFLSPKIKMQVNLYARINIIATYQPSLVITEDYYARIVTNPANFEAFIDAIHAVLERRKEASEGKVAQIMLRHLPFCTLNKYIISHIISFLHGVQNNFPPRLLIETQAPDTEVTKGVQPFNDNVEKIYYRERKFREYKPRNIIEF